MTSPTARHSTAPHPAPPQANQANGSFRFCIRSYIALVLTPQPPIVDWLARLDDWTKDTPAFFAGRPVALDLGALRLGAPGIAHLLAQLAQRRIHVIGIEGLDPADVGPTMPPLLTGARNIERSAAARDDDTEAPPSAASEPLPPASLLIEVPIRSGQTVIFPNGDVTVLGSVASGSEIVAGGSIHVYGTLRGRAMAGAQGNERARIFCNKNEAELLAINGYYRTAEELSGEIRSRPVQSWLENGVVRVAPLD